MVDTVLLAWCGGRRTDEGALIADIIALASQYERYGYRRITALLREAGWAANVKRVERLWRREGSRFPRSNVSASMPPSSPC
jgi:transposase InsO family protein